MGSITAALRVLLYAKKTFQAQHKILPSDHQSIGTPMISQSGTPTARCVHKSLRSAGRRCLSGSHANDSQIDDLQIDNSKTAVVRSVAGQNRASRSKVARSGSWEVDDG